MVAVVSMLASIAAIVAIISVVRTLPGDWISATSWRQPSIVAAENTTATTRQFARLIRFRSKTSMSEKLLVSLDDMGAMATGSETFETQVDIGTTSRWSRSRPPKIDLVYLESRIVELENLTELEIL